MSLSTSCLMTESRKCVVVVSSFLYHLLHLIFSVSFYHLVTNALRKKIHVARLPTGVSWAEYVRAHGRYPYRDIKRDIVVALCRFHQARQVLRMLLLVFLLDLDLCSRPTVLDDRISTQFRFTSLQKYSRANEHRIELYTHCSISRFSTASEISEH